MKLYAVIRYFLRLATRLYFVEVSSVGKERVPAQGPVILAANHPSSILDSVLLGTELPRPVHYLAKSELFRSPFLARLYRRCGAIPIERGVGGDQELTFLQLYRILEEGRCVGIFPEGRNSPYRQVARLRTGAARIAFGAEARNLWQLGVKVIPVGLNFESRELFMSAVQLRFGDPIDITARQADFTAQPTRAVRALTRDIEDQLRQLTLHVEDSRLTQLVEDLATLYSAEKTARQADQRPAPLKRSRRFRPMQRVISWFRPQLIEPINLSDALESRQRINALLHSVARADPAAIEELRQRIDRYQAHLRQHDLRLDLRQRFDQPLRERLIRLRMTAYAILMAPVAAFGFVHNAVPYLFSLFVGRRFRNDAVRAFAYFGVGTLAFTGAYTLFGFWMWQFTERSLVGSLTYLATLPPTGFLCLRYRRRITQYRARILVRTFFRRQDTMRALLREERNQIFERLEDLAEQHPQPAR